MLPSAESSASSTSHGPLVTGVASPPEAGTVYRCAHPLRSEPNQTVSPSFRNPPVLGTCGPGEPIQALSRSCATTRASSAGRSTTTQ